MALINPKANLWYFCLSIVCQILGFALGQATLALMQALRVSALSIGFYSNILILILIHSISAFFIARWLSLPKAWQLFNLLILPACLTYELGNLPSYLLLIAIAASALVYLPTFWTRVPYYPTSKHSYQVIAEILKDRAHFRFLDLGCGFAPLLFYLSKHYPNSHFTGVEISPLPYLAAKLRVHIGRHKNVQIHAKNFWKMNFSSYDVAYAFLAPGPMEKLWEKVKNEMRPGSTFISNSFEVPSQPDKTIHLEDKKKSRIMVHQLY